MKFKAFSEKKAEAQAASWQEEVDGSINRSSRELGIYNQAEIDSRFQKFYQELMANPALEFVKKLQTEHPEAEVYLVGGSVRDAIRGKEAKDVDLVISRIDPIDLVDFLLAQGKVTFDRHPNLDLGALAAAEKERVIKECYGVIKFVPGEGELAEPIDIALPRIDDYGGTRKTGVRGVKRDTETKANPNLPILADLERRDLTINTLVLNLANGKLIDYFDGIGDLIRGQIKAVGDPEKRILDEDLSRGFRAMRFACVFGAEIEAKTRQAIKQIFKPAEISSQELYQADEKILAAVQKQEAEIRRLFALPADQPLPRFLQVFWDKEQKKPRQAVPVEVMSKEIIKAFQADPDRFIKLFDDVGGLALVFPELARLKEIAQSRDHHSEGNAFRHTQLLFAKINRDDSLRLKLAALFHDLGKAETAAKQADGRITFHGHGKESRDLTEKIIRGRLRLPVKDIKDTIWLVENHMLPLHLDLAAVRPSKLEKVFLADPDLGEDLLKLAEADISASRPDGGQADLTPIIALRERLAEIKKNLEKNQHTPLVRGADLLAMGFEPGRIFSQILKAVRDKQAKGSLQSREEALAFVREKYLDKG